MSSGKPHLNLVVIGHVDHGKSTTIGHLFYATKSIDERTIAKYEEESKQLQDEPEPELESELSPAEESA